MLEKAQHKMNVKWTILICTYKNVSSWSAKNKNSKTKMYIFGEKLKKKCDFYEKNAAKV